MAAEEGPSLKRLRRVAPKAPPVLNSPALEAQAANVTAPVLAREQDECKTLPAGKEEDILDEGHAAVQNEVSHGLCVGQADSDPATTPAEMDLEAMLAAEEEKNKVLQLAVLERKLVDLRARNQKLADVLEPAPAAPVIAEETSTTATVGKDSVINTLEVQPRVPPPPPAPPKASAMTPSAWGLDEAHDQAEARYVDEHGPQKRIHDPRIDPPVGLTDDVHAEFLWRVEWLLPRVDAQTAAQFLAESQDLNDVDATGKPLPHDSSGSVQLAPEFVPAPAAADAAHVPGAPTYGLPDGWTRIYSKSNPGKHYYFNKTTGKTAWEKPLF